MVYSATTVDLSQQLPDEYTLPGVMKLHAAHVGVLLHKSMQSAMLGVAMGMFSISPPISTQPAGAPEQVRPDEWLLGSEEAGAGAGAGAAAPVLEAGRALPLLLLLLVDGAAAVTVKGATGPSRTPPMVASK